MKCSGAWGGATSRGPSHEEDVAVGRSVELASGGRSTKRCDQLLERRWALLQELDGDLRASGHDDVGALSREGLAELADHRLRIVCVPLPGLEVVYEAVVVRRVVAVPPREV